MQTEISQPEGQRIMPETRRFTSFPTLSVDPWVGMSRSNLVPALSVDPLVGISRSTSETDDR